jgi:hypothetical protein
MNPAQVYCTRNSWGDLMCIMAVQDHTWACPLDESQHRWAFRLPRQKIMGFLAYPV